LQPFLVFLAYFTDTRLCIGEFREEYEIGRGYVMASVARQSRGELFDFYTGLLRFARNDGGV
jgi:hypothetical protein